MYPENLNIDHFNVQVMDLNVLKISWIDELFRAFNILNKL